VRPRSVHNPTAQAQRQQQLTRNAELQRELAARCAAARAARRQVTTERKQHRQQAGQRRNAARQRRRQLHQQLAVGQQELDALARLMTQRPRPGSRWQQ
jgi:hypothetical protein